MVRGRLQRRPVRVRTTSRPDALTWCTYVVPSAALVTAGVDVTEAAGPPRRPSLPRSSVWANVVPRLPTATRRVRPDASRPRTGATCVAHEPALPTRSGRLQPSWRVRRRVARVPVG